MIEDREAELAILNQEVQKILVGDPLLQNIAAVMSALLEPVSVDFIAELATNADGVSEAHRLEVTPDHINKFIELIEQIEKSQKIQLLEKAPIKSGDAGAAPDEAAIQKIDPEIGYRFSENFRKFIEEKYPDLFSSFHGIIADKLMASFKDMFKSV